MTSFAQTITTFLSLGIVAIQLASLFILGLVFFNQKKLGAFIARHVLSLSLIVTVMGVMGSYTYSSVIGFVPCQLCWYARILLFPQAILFAVAWIRARYYKVTSREVFVNSLILSIIGVLVTGFHYYGQMFDPSALAGCEASGISCSQLPFVSFGYITIPMMAFSTFVLLLAFAIAHFKFSSK